MLLQPDLQPPCWEDLGVEGHLAGGAGGVVQHHAGDGEALPVQEARLGDLLRPQLGPFIAHRRIALGRNK